MSVTLIVGDIHLGRSRSIGRPGIGNALNSRVVDQSNLLDWSLERAIEHGADSIVCTGDICEDVKPDYALMELFIDWLKKCVSFNIEVDVIYGNHDLKRTGARHASYLDLIDAMDLPGVCLFKNIQTIFRDGVGFTMVPFRDRRSLGCKTNEEGIAKIAKQLPYELAEIPTHWDKVLIGHLALAGSIFVGDEFDNLSNELMCPIDMFNGYDYVWMGHVHKPQVRQKEPTYVAHVGSLDISDFGEVDHEKIVILYDSNDPFKFKEIVVPSRPLRHISVDVPDGVDSTTYVLKALRALHKKNANANGMGGLSNAIVRIEVKLLDEDLEPINREMVEEEVYRLGAFYICSLSESKSVSVIPIAQQQAISNTIQPKAAIDVWAKHDSFDTDQERQDWKEVALGIVEEFYAKN